MVHKEGYSTLGISFIVLGLLCWLVKLFLPSSFTIFLIIAIALFLFLISFFRNPKREIPQRSENILYAPADGKVVVIEDIEERAYLNAPAKQVSIFMSPLNVHVNRNPIDGKIIHSQYHEGKFLPAWDPKSSLENERTTVVYETPHGKIVLRQIAGALAKRIINYAKIGDQAKQGEDMGFIKFGSRVDLFLPMNAQIMVSKNDVVFGNRTIIAKW